MPETLLRKFRKELTQVADPKKAPQMQAYMKSVMPFHGVPAPVLRKLSQAFFKDLVFKDAQDWKKQVLSFWNKAKFREERYAALHLAGHRRAYAYQTPAAMSLYEDLIVTGAWWDFVDTLAIDYVGPILLSHPKSMKPLMRRWSRSADLWKRRASIICQISFKDQTDLKLLYECIEPSIESKEFFLRKAIGWALREIAWRDPAEVKRYVKLNAERLSGLSQREALKNL